MGSSPSIPGISGLGRNGVIPAHAAPEEHWRWALGSEQPRAELSALRKATRLERRLASAEMVQDLETRFGVRLIARRGVRRESGLRADSGEFGLAAG